MKRLVLAAAALALTTTAEAACLNKFLNRQEGPRQVVTLLTGKLTFQEAQKLAADISNRQAPASEWLDEDGKSIAKQFGELKVVRPMPVGCDGKTSGVVVIVSFPTGVTPTKKMTVKLNPETSVVFEQQAD